MTGKVFAVGLGPGRAELITPEAMNALNSSNVIIGYQTYIEMLHDILPEKKYISFGMRQEIMRCEEALALSRSGLTVSVVCSGDSGIYGMAELLLSHRVDGRDGEVVVIPGITAAISAASRIGCPLSNDFVVISLSDLMTPWETIEKRLRAAIEGDFVISLYNPSSSGRRPIFLKACDILEASLPSGRICGMGKNIGRPGEVTELFPLSRLREMPADMRTIFFIGSSESIAVNGKMLTRRGYERRRP